MRKRLALAPYLAPILLFGMLSCEKHATSSSESKETGVACISDQTRTLPAVDTFITQQAMDTALALYSQNNLSTANLQFCSVVSNSYEPPGYTSNVHQVDICAYRWYNNLPVFLWNDNVTFYNGIFQPQASTIFSGDAPGPDATFHQTLASLQTIWQNNFMRVSTYWPLQNVQNPTHPAASYRDSCLIAERGYIDAGYFNANGYSYAGRLVKAWTVAPLNGIYPMVIISDDTGTAWPSNIYIP
jgi:hypothetical protein